MECIVIQRILALFIIEIWIIDEKIISGMDDDDDDDTGSDIGDFDIISLRTGEVFRQ